LFRLTPTATLTGRIYTAKSRLQLNNNPEGVGFLPPILLEATTDGRWHVAAALPALLGTWWLSRFVRRGWHTLGDPVHGVLIAPVENGKVLDDSGDAIAAQVQSAHKPG